MWGIGKKGNEGPTRGKKAVTYIVTLPDGTTAMKRNFNPPISPTGYAYQQKGVWYVDVISEPNNPRLSHLRQCPARPRSLVE
jgi:hypothetical protein